ncbi:hypothetical protein HBH70_120910 [Parastagonospora nodorum]|nr:hypothetical protein HBH53_141530 [Parastagonospora nodorum]KAH3966333.1 hypothetical protein HBH51_143840 [Parastagonospora nodorum]KAH4034267.1 hypothetical protein HBI09_108290 [Parastagonospora nodorum]KAH4109927.1 hypothetical protein HBH46_015440 [Parastagonospora nodorum]KAH4214914.1 hypothetical protein HBI95_014560 [Parastagonospora nodorum]
MGRIKEPESPEITPRIHPASAAVPPLQFLHFWSTEFAAMVETVTWKAVATRQETPEDVSRLLWNWDSWRCQRAKSSKPEQCATQRR